MSTGQRHNVAEWLREEQAAMGITYTLDDAEERLRVLVEDIAYGLDGIHARVETIGCEYHGYTARPTADGGERRTTMRALTASIQLADGTIYGLKLHGPMNVGGTPTEPGMTWEAVKP